MPGDGQGGVAARTGQRSPQATVAAKAPKPKKRGAAKILIIVLALFVIAGGGAFAYLRMAAPKGPVVLPSVAADLGEFTTNLADPGATKVIQIDLTIEVTGQSAADLVKEKMPAVKDAVNSTLHTFHSADLQDSKGLDDLRSALSSAIDVVLGADDVRAVYLTRFVIQ